MTAHRLLALLLSGAATILLLSLSPALVFASPSAPDNTGLSYSTDGVNYSADPPPLFADAPKVVPGEEVRGVLWVRNTRPHSVYVSVQTSGPDTTSGIILGPASPGTATLGVGESKAITVRAWLPTDAGNETQERIAENMQVLVHARDAHPLVEDPEPPEDEIPENPDQPRDELGDTGFENGLLPLAVGVVAVGAVLYAIARSRARKERNAERNLL